MASQSHYEINICRLVTPAGLDRPRYQHFFATAERSLVTDADLEHVLPVILAAFPEPEYRVEVSYWKTEGTSRVVRADPPTRTPPAPAPGRALRRAYATRRGGRGG